MQQQDSVNNKHRTDLMARHRTAFHRFLQAYGEAFQRAEKLEERNMLNDLADTFNYRLGLILVRLECDPMFAVNGAMPVMHQPFGYSPRAAMPVGHTVSYSTCGAIDENGNPEFVEPAVAIMNEIMVPINEAVESINKFAAMLEAAGYSATGG